MQFDPNGRPVSGSTRSAWRDEVGAYAPVALVVIFLAGFIWFLYWIVSMPTVGGSTADSTPVILVAQDPLPPEILEAARALATTFAPTMTPTPKPATPIPSPIPQTPTCEALMETGVCVWAQRPQPPVTFPTCDTPVPYQTCYKERKGLFDSYATPEGTPVSD